MKKEIIKKIIIFIIILILFGIIGFFGLKQYQIYKTKNLVKPINKVLEENKVSRDNCIITFKFDKTLINNKNNNFFDENKYSKFKKRCDAIYNIANSKIEENFCKSIIVANKIDFEDRFIVLNEFNTIRNKCISKFLKVEFGTGSFFEIEKDFKSSININFSLDFFEDRNKVDSEEFIQNRINAKKKLINLLAIEPKVNLGVDDIILYKKRAILNLDLKSKTEYKFKLKSVDFGIGEKAKTEDFILQVPENKFFGFKINEKVSLFEDIMQPKFTFYKFNSDKKEAKIKICRIDNESYAKIEVYDNFPNRKFRDNFFKTGIDKIKTFDCKTKTISLISHLQGGGAGKTEEGDLVKQEFDFSSEIGKSARSGLYYVTFENLEDREYKGRIQKPIFFGIIDSHITMKIGGNKSAFFFVNDFSGKPIANQEIRVYLNNFKSKKRDNQYINGKYIDKTIFYSPFEKNVLSKPIYLGKTNFKGILNVNLKNKIDDVFERTLESRGYSWDGNLNSLFVTSTSKTHLSFVSSKHNGGITPWNFGYSIGSWWYGDESENQDEIILKKWGEDKEIVSHIFTDRKLYLPNEEVNIKAILRNSSNLSIPKNKEISIVVRDSKNKEILNTELLINSFGSINKSIKLNKNAVLGKYSIELRYNKKRIGNSGFSVEIFKNPKFKTEVMLETEGLNGDLVKINQTKIENKYGRENKKYLGDFKIKTKISSKYYSGPSVANAKFKYKVYKQYYYDNSYWDDCYFGCYWEPNKEFYSEGIGLLDDNGMANFDINVKFKSDYSDYKYIVEVTITDKAGDTISSSNSIIAKLPSEYKNWNPNSGIKFETKKRFYKSGEEINIKGKLSNGKFSDYYNDKFLLIIKRKDYENREVLDIRGKKVNKILSKEKIEKILKVNTNNFKLNDDGSLNLKYKVITTGEYVFEYGKINKDYFLDSSKIIEEFKKISNSASLKGREETTELGTKNKLFIIRKLDKKIKVNWDNYNSLRKYCFSEKPKDCDRKNILKKLDCSKDYIDDKCRNTEQNIELDLKIKVDDLIDPDSRKYFTIISYGNDNAKNPIVSDNKIGVLSEKISYHIGEKARILIRLPSSNGRILLTTEKAGVVKSELIRVKSNIFFKEFRVDNSFAPNTYIGVLFIPGSHTASTKGVEQKIPEYKVGYTEIVVDKTDKKAFVEIKTNKKIYKPRETVKLDINIKNKENKGVKSELTVMVVDDSLISLMGNVDLNTLEKFYKKLPFRIQTSITNIAMLRNYYFSRKGIVGGSGFGDFKGGDSAVSSRNIFRNTAFYNANIITDWNGKAHVEFNLPDNLTNFRVMVVANSIQNIFGMGQEFIEVRKNVIIEDKTPLILRNGDVSQIGAQIFNNTKKTIGFKVELNMFDVKEEKQIKNVFIGAGKSKIINFEIIVGNNIKKLNYVIKAMGNSADNSDKLEGNIEIKSSPVLITNFINNLTIPGADKEYGIGEAKIDIPKNIDLSKSKIEVVFSNNNLVGIEKIISSLAKYPYGCIEQTISSTLPNAILLKFSKTFGDLIKNKDIAKANLKIGIDGLESMQLKSGGFSYWQDDSLESGLKINAYVLSSMLEIQKVYKSEKLNNLINNSIKYLESKILLENENNISNSDKVEIFYSLSKAKNITKIEINSEILSRYELLKYTYGLFYSDKELFKSEIENNISKLKILFEKDTETNNYYSNIINEKAIFARLLFEGNYDSGYSDMFIKELYKYDWSSYYYSTKTKANAFLAFAKYLENNSVNKINKFGFSLGTNFNKGKPLIVGGKHVIKKFEYNLSDLLLRGDNSINFKGVNLTKGNLYVNIIFKQYPKDILKVKPYSNKVGISRKIYEVLDESMLDKCNNYWNYNYRKYSQEFTFACDNSLSQVLDNTYKKGGLYMVKIIADFKGSKNRENFVLEDYLPGTFRILNSKFKTESAFLKQNQNNWSWNHIEYRPEVVMAHNRYIWGNSRELSYFVRPEFKGIYTLPPVTGYFMYNPAYRANSEFNIIEVK